MKRGNGRLVGLVVLDGWGLAPQGEGNAVALARTPVMDRLLAAYPHATLVTCGESVGLPPGQMGNSEVGHLNLGAGRIVYQDLTRIDQAIRDGSLASNEVFREALARGAAGGTFHLAGLVSPGGVHSHERHVDALLRYAAEAGVKRIRVHAFTDGRDTPPRSADASIAALERTLGSIPGAAIATVSGRFYAMDRDKRWDRTERAYRALVLGEGETAASGEEAVAAAYTRGESDEFVKPTVIRGADGSIRDGDTVVAFNFRPDRMRQISRALADPGFDAFPRPVLPKGLHYVCMTEYDETFRFPVICRDEPLRRTVGEVVSEAGIRQLRIAETEKYAHVTYFFNGSEETPFPGEDRVLIPSPKVSTYDEKPEMSAAEVTAELERRLADPAGYGFFVLNYANADMVGHTGVIEAAVRAVETVDTCLGRVLEAVRRRGGVALVTADHGNAEQMIDPATGGPHTAHTLNPVPFLAAGGEALPMRAGILADVAPTLLELMGLPQPPEMTGRSLLQD
jgi:2,3-bisphosphoglycerate-independent phosphoglycerate mutase